MLLSNKVIGEDRERSGCKIVLFFFCYKGNVNILLPLQMRERENVLSYCRLCNP